MPIYLQHGNMIDYVPPTDMTTDDVVFIGGLVGIPQFPMKSGQAGSLSVDGIYQFDKKEGVAVNFGDVVKYCGTTKLAQDSNADLTLGVAVADADADSLGVKVKINSVLPTDGGGGGGSGEVALCGASGLYFDEGGRVAIKYLPCSAIKANEYGIYPVVCSCSAIRENGDGFYLAICTASGLSIQNGELVASGGGGGDIEINPYGGLEFGCGGLSVKIGNGLSFGCSGELNATGGGGGGGLQNLASGYGSLSIIGESTTSNNSITIGNCSNAIGDSSIAIGTNARVAMNGCGSIAIGLNAEARTTKAGCGSIVIGNGINPYSDSALLIIGGNGDYGNSRQGVLFYSPLSDFREVSGSSENGGIAYVSSSDKGNSWTISCNLSF